MGLSLLASIISTITYLSHPGEIIKHGLGANSQLLSYPVVFVLVGYLVVPFLMKLKISSAYECLERQYDLPTRLFGASIFVLIRLAWMGTIVFTAAGALATISGLPFATVVLGVAAVGTLYTTLGGIRAVIWTDVVQFFILLAGALFTIAYIAFDAGTGPVTWYHQMASAEMESQTLFSVDPTVRLSWFGMITWTLFWWICTAAGDQVAVQRYLSTDSALSARRSFACNLTASVVITLLLSLCGWLSIPTTWPISPRTRTASSRTSSATSSPGAWPDWWRPPSSPPPCRVLDSGINSISSVVITDYYGRPANRGRQPPGGVDPGARRHRGGGIVAILTCFLLDSIPDDQRGNLFDLTAGSAASWWALWGP